MPKFYGTPSGNNLLRLRLLSAAVGLPVLAGVLVAGTLWLAVAAILIWLLAFREMSSLITVSKAPLIRAYLAMWGAFVIGMSLFGGGTVLIVAAAGLILLFALTFRPLRIGDSVKDWGINSVPILIVSIPLASIVLLRADPHGLQWILLALGGTFSCDTAAYACGKILGRRPMAPRVSPNKTWEGSAGGFFAAVGATFALVAILGLGVPWFVAVPLGALIGIISQAGDLLESWMKRTAGVKNSGGLIPGHGGIMDRLDSLVPVLPLVYYVSKVWPIVG